MAIINPIKPEEILKKKFESIPNAMIEAVNVLLAKNWVGNESRIRRDDLLNEYFGMIGEVNDLDARDVIYKNHWLDFESIYREAGWNVKYEKPSYGDNNFEPFYSFTIKSK